MNAALRCDESPVEPLRVDVGSTSLSGLVARVARPRGVVLAIHGGASRASYFDGSAHPDQSLLTLAARLGFTAVALDRPGYGASRGQVDGMDVEARADLLAAGVRAAVDDLGAGIVVVGHSLGTQVATHVAARAEGVIGLDFSGSAVEYLMRWTERNGSPDASPRGVFDLIWGDPALYPEGAMAREYTRSARGPASEGVDALAWPRQFPSVAPRIRVPVRVTMAEHEQIWLTSPESMASLEGLFTAAPRVEVRIQPGAPHNISLSLAARAYHLHVLAFAEECVQWARSRPALSAIRP